MLRNRGLREGQFVNDVAANTGRSAGEKPYDLYASRMPQGFCVAGQFFVRFWPLNGTNVRAYVGRLAGVGRRLG